MQKLLKGEISPPKMFKFQYSFICLSDTWAIKVSVTLLFKTRSWNHNLMACMWRVICEELTFLILVSISTGAFPFLWPPSKIYSFASQNRISTNCTIIKLDSSKQNLFGQNSLLKKELCNFPWICFFKIWSFYNYSKPRALLFDEKFHSVAM